MSHHIMTGSLRQSALLVFLCLIATSFLVSASVAQGIANSVCAECHTEVSESFHMTPHGTYFGAEAGLKEQNCEACHGPGAAHVESGDAADILNPARVEGSDGNELCLTCDWRNGRPRIIARPTSLARPVTRYTAVHRIRSRHNRPSSATVVTPMSGPQP
jgi:hypothetical protein